MEARTGPPSARTGSKIATAHSKASPPARSSRSTAHLLGDGGDDRIIDPDSDRAADTDNDAQLDWQATGEGHYHDGDDGRFTSKGSPANAADTRAVTALVRRYYVLAASGNARAACLLLVPSLRREIAIQDGRYGPRYLHRARNCRELLALVFRHAHRQLVAPVTVTSVTLVAPDHAYVLLGSPRMPASFITPVRSGGRWMLDESLGSVLS